jgi:peptide/nickel transport system permease protein
VTELARPHQPQVPDPMKGPAEDIATAVVAPLTVDEHDTGAAPPKKMGVLFWICLGWLVLNVFLAVFANLLPFPNPNYQTVATNAGPGWGHLLGTDDLGRDILSRLIYGARVSLVIGFVSVVIGLVLGGVTGLWAGFRRGAGDTILNGLSLVLLAFPPLVAIIAIVAFWGQTEWKIILIIGIVSSPFFFRVVRASTLTYSTREFVTASRTLGATNGRILVREILPNVMPAIVSYGLIGVATVIILEGALAFLGLSVQNPTASWGNMLNEGQGILGENLWLILFPALALVTFLISLNLVADKLRQRFDVGEGML